MFAARCELKKQIRVPFVPTGAAACSPSAKLMASLAPVHPPTAPVNLRDCVPACAYCESHTNRSPPGGRKGQSSSIAFSSRAFWAHPVGSSSGTDTKSAPNPDAAHVSPATSSGVVAVEVAEVVPLRLTVDVADDVAVVVPLSDTVVVPVDVRVVVGDVTSQFGRFPACLASSANCSSWAVRLQSESRNSGNGARHSVVGAGPPPWCGPNISFRIAVMSDADAPQLVPPAACSSCTPPGLL